jgi:ribonuclease PH
MTKTTRRHDGRAPSELRKYVMKRKWTHAAAGSVLVSCGRTTLLVTASAETNVPPWLRGQGKGWVTAEYAMLPGSTSPRKSRDRGPKTDGRTIEIQRLIGRSLRAAIDLRALGERSVTIDCDVLEADGGTRTTAITAGFVALVDALRALDVPLDAVLKDSIAAVSVGMVGGRPVVDLDYAEDSTAEVDMNVVMTGSGELVEVQGTGEGATFSVSELGKMVDAAKAALPALLDVQRRALGRSWPFAKR